MLIDLLFGEYYGFLLFVFVYPFTWCQVFILVCYHTQVSAHTHKKKVSIVISL